jgi:hypothetical protein
VVATLARPTKIKNGEASKNLSARTNWDRTANRERVGDERYARSEGEPEVPLEHDRVPIRGYTQKAVQQDEAQDCRGKSDQFRLVRRHWLHPNVK